jgi:flagellar export protein FliJ
MKRYRFRLDSVLRVRRIEEDRAAVALAVAQAQAAAEARRQHAAETAYTAIAHKDAEGARAVATYLAQRSLADSAAASLIIARHRAAVAHDDVEARRNDWTDAAGRVTGLERLDERGREVHADDLEREEAAHVDDLVTSRHNRGDDR